MFTTPDIYTYPGYLYVPRIFIRTPDIYTYPRIFILPPGYLFVPRIFIRTPDIYTYPGYLFVPRIFIRTPDIYTYPGYLYSDRTPVYSLLAEERVRTIADESIPFQSVSVGVILSTLFCTIIAFFFFDLPVWMPLVCVIFSFALSYVAVRLVRKK